MALDDFDVSLFVPPVPKVFAEIRRTILRFVFLLHSLIRAFTQRHLK